jgi:hypothetical protein
MKGGITALATHALLEAGVPRNHAAIAKAVAYLEKLAPEKTYVVSLQTQVLARVDPKKHAKLIQNNVDWLLENAIRTQGKIAGWSYPANHVSDGSNTHFAVMALDAAATAGAKIDAKVWPDIRAMYEQSQQGTGWSYYPGRGSPTLSMTVSGVLCLAVAAKHDKNARGRGKVYEIGMAAMIDRRGQVGKSEGYRLFATAELGRVLGGTEFTAGKKKWPWYREGAGMLLQKQGEDGSFELGAGIDGTRVLSTAFALYFLSLSVKA